MCPYPLNNQEIRWKKYNFRKTPESQRDLCKMVMEIFIIIQ